MLAGRRYELEPVSGLRVGVLRRQLDDPDLSTRSCAARVEEAARARSPVPGSSVVDVDVPELDLVDEALGPIIFKEAFDIHRRWLETEADGYGPGTRALLELGSRDHGRAVPRRAWPTRSASPPASRPCSRRSTSCSARPSPTSRRRRIRRSARLTGDVEARYAGPYNLAGIPAVSIPCGLAEDGLPAGLQLAAGLHREALLLSVARAYEEVSP